MVKNGWLLAGSGWGSAVRRKCTGLGFANVTVVYRGQGLGGTAEVQAKYGVQTKTKVQNNNQHYPTLSLGCFSTHCRSRQIMMLQSYRPNLALRQQQSIAYNLPSCRVLAPRQCTASTAEPALASTTSIRVGSRGSKLARLQAEQVTSPSRDASGVTCAWEPAVSGAGSVELVFDASANPTCSCSSCSRRCTCCVVHCEKGGGKSRSAQVQQEKGSVSCVVHCV